VSQVPPGGINAKKMTREKGEENGGACLGSPILLRFKCSAYMTIEDGSMREAPITDR
jgi:hypothetical protein